MSKESEAELLRDILKQDYALPADIADSLKLPLPQSPSDISQSDVEEAEKWLKRKYDNKKRRK